MPKSLFDKAPFVRIIVPFAAGIALQEVSPNFIVWTFLSVGLIFLTIHFLSLRDISLRYRYRFAFTVASTALFLTAGCALWQIVVLEEFPANNPNHYDYAVARIDKISDDSSRLLGCQAKIFTLIENDSIHRETDLNITLWIEKKQNDTLYSGDLILFHPRLTPITNRKNPEAFDYATLMRHRGFLFTQYLDASNWRKVGHANHRSLKNIALYYREQGLQLLDHGNFSPEAQNILKALLLGYTDELAPQQREAFSTAGLSHILAVSGLHLGIVWALLALLLVPLSRYRLSYLRHFIILLALWGYAFLTGLSPSVIRATTMASAIIIGFLIGRRSHPLNSLFVAAFLMLLINPHYLFQVGFQLSFLSVLFILLLYRPLYQVFSHNPKVFPKLASLLAVSAAAQIGTLPLVIYYFHTFPLIGLVTNLIVVPLLPILLGGGFLWLILAHAGIFIPLLTRCINDMTIGIEHITLLSSSCRWCSLQGIWIEPSIFVLTLVIVFAGSFILLSRNKRGFIGLLAFTFFYLTIDTLSRRQPLDNTWVIYQESGQTTTLNFILENTNLLLPLDTLSQRTIEREAQRFWLKHSLDNFCYISDSTTRHGLKIQLPYISFGNKRFLVLNDNRWKDVSSSQRMSIDYAIVAPGFKGKIDDIRQIFDIELIVLSHNLPYFQQEKLAEECRRLRISHHRIRTEGALITKL